ncbi:MAG TPA: (d)CMP kinase [Tepidisphaeraceae bacterium]|nr:(d)CMP kinase [Tepidisphaeraceae bacterium]
MYTELYDDAVGLPSTIDPRDTNLNKMIITIDGPAGTGKSSVALEVARVLGFDFLDTGAMYRAIGLAALRREIDLDDKRELAFVAVHSRIWFDWSKRPPAVMLNGEAVTHLLRSGEATRAASYVAVVPAIREMLVRQQQAIGRERANLVTEGRDQGTIVFPEAEFKYYLDAKPEERARRRTAQLRARGEIVDPTEILNQIVTRDKRDREREVGPLSIPKDARIIDTTTITQEEVIKRIVAEVQSRATVS